MRTSNEGTFRSWDGTELFRRHWPPASPGGDRALLLIHRGHEHSGRLQALLDALDLPGFHAFAWDARGHGRSPGPRGHAADYLDHVRDLEAFAQLIRAEHGIAPENMAVVANSVGAVTATAWVHDHAPRLRALVLAAPAFRIRLYVPGAIPGLRLLLKANRRATISSYVKSKMLTHDPEQSRSYDEDPLITRDIAVNVLLGLHDTSTRLLADAGAIVTPTLLLSAGADYVVENRAQRRFFEALSSPRKEMETFPGFFHALLYEKERARPIARARDFILRAFEAPVDLTRLQGADAAGYTFEEYRRLREPAPFPLALGYALQRAALATAGRLSEGIRLGWDTGFDSGRSLDYVYENRARGITPLGRLIDRGYLDAIGWRGIRQRGENLKAALRDALARVLARQPRVRILDVATGCGRYVLDVLRERPQEEAEALLRDLTPANLEAGRRLADAMGLRNVRYEQADAFDAASLAAVAPRPDIAVVSGLYELFPDNAPVLRSLRGIAEALAPGGLLVYTGQPWHPQVEMIARTLRNRDGAPWIMRRRTQAEMDELVRCAGLDKIRTTPDAFGIFTVSVAQKGPTP